MERMYEQLSAYFNVIGMAGISAFTILGRRLKPVGGFGPCNVCSREDYFAVGGHVRAKGAILESLPLGQAFLATGRPVHCLGGRGTLSFRMYPGGLGSLIEGFGKGFALGAQAMPLAALVMTICWICAGMDVTRHLVHSVLSWRGQESAVWLALYLLHSAQLYWMLARIGNFRCSTALLFPVSLVFFVLVFFRSLVDTFLLKRVSWKGRRIDMQGTGREDT
jgi:4,4'-diaponeurosporenoate glycosyltransferase